MFCLCILVLGMHCSMACVFGMESGIASGEKSKFIFSYVKHLRIFFVAFDSYALLACLSDSYKLHIHWSTVLCHTATIVGSFRF